MSVQYDKVFEGVFTYIEKGAPYSEEVFKVLKDNEKNTLVYKSEQLTRVSTGEFLKIECFYEVNNNWVPIHVTVKKSMGPLFTIETYTPDLNTQMLHYEFKNNDSVHTYERSMASRYQISTPSFVTTLIFAQTKKFDSLGRHAFNLVYSNNTWEYTAPFEDKLIFVEFKTHEKTEIQINGQSLPCILCLAFAQDASQASTELPITFYMSKHLSIPYKMEMPDGMTVQMKKLKKFEIQSIQDIFNSK